MQHTLIAKVENKPGVLNRVASLFRRRNFNIESLNVGHTENPNVSRMTIVVDKPDLDARKVEANLYKLVNVLDVLDVTNQPTVTRDLALIKVAAEPEKRAEVANLANIFRAHIVDVAPDSIIVEITGTEDKIEGLVELLRPIGITEMVRTGQVAMLRGDEPGIRYTPGANGHPPSPNGHKNISDKGKAQ
ncbi:MAG: acetolactate synthase small subunit [Chloroflexota bacterium]